VFVVEVESVLLLLKSKLCCPYDLMHSIWEQYLEAIVAWSSCCLKCLLVDQEHLGKWSLLGQAVGCWSSVSGTSLKARDL
jgi:hypothetical protein